MARRIALDLMALRASREFRLLLAAEGLSMIGGLIVVLTAFLPALDRYRRPDDGAATGGSEAETGSGAAR